jgi:hypothetical protein
MAYQRLQVSNAVNVIPSDTVPIPNPATFVLNGSANMSVAGTLTDVGTTFTTAGIQKNAILYALSSGLAYRVVSVDSDTQLSLEPSVAAAPAEVYVIYNAATLGATLYVGGIGNVSVEMAANKDLSASIGGLNPLIFSNVPQGSFMPTLVTRVNATNTTATLIKALF